MLFDEKKSLFWLLFYHADKPSKPVVKVPLVAVKGDSVTLECVTSSLGKTMYYEELKPNSITLAGSKLVADRIKAKFHYAIWFKAGRRPASNQLRTC